MHKMKLWGHLLNANHASEIDSELKHPVTYYFRLMTIAYGQQVIVNIHRSRRPLYSFINVDQRGQGTHGWNREVEPRNLFYGVHCIPRWFCHLVNDDIGAFPRVARGDKDIVHTRG